MSLWSIITGAGKVGDVVDTGLDVIKSGVKGLDAMVYTSEEQAVAGAKNVADNMAHVLALAQLRQNESGASAVTRRLVALIVLGNFSVFVQAGLVCVILNKMEMVSNLIEFAKAIMIGQMALTIVVSMFGYYAYTKGKK